MKIKNGNIYYFTHNIVTNEILDWFIKISQKSGFKLEVNFRKHVKNTKCFIKVFENRLYTLSNNELDEYDKKEIINLNDEYKHYNKVYPITKQSLSKTYTIFISNEEIVKGAISKALMDSGVDKNLNSNEYQKLLGKLVFISSITD